MKWKWRLIWLSLLGLLWLFCSGTASATPLVDRIAEYPHWPSQPALQPVQTEDLTYPGWFAGDWWVTTTLLDMQAPLAPQVVTPGFESNRQFLDRPISFQIRFVATEPARSWWSRLSPVEPQLVSDRAYNGKQLAKAYLGERSVLAVKVDPKNPNRQITLLRGDRQLVSTVVARATEMPDADDFVTSEFFKQEFRGTPQLYFNEVENTTVYSKQKQGVNSSAPEIVADQITAIYLSPQDTNYFKTLSNENPLSSPRPVALYRYRMEFRSCKRANCDFNGSIGG